jgi:hypothetical protein
MTESTVAVHSTVVAWSWPEMWLAAGAIVTTIAEADDLRVLFFSGREYLKGGHGKDLFDYMSMVRAHRWEHSKGAGKPRPLPSTPFFNQIRVVKYFKSFPINYFFVKRKSHVLKGLHLKYILTKVDYF